MTGIRASTETLARDDQLRRLVDRLSLEQKVRLLTGADFWSLHPEPEIGLRRIVVSDGPAGVRGELWDERSTSANVPCPTALAATWDLDLVEAVGSLLAGECRRKGVDVLLAPTVNLHRSPFGGRHFECFSEDPVLTADVGAAFVRGVQSQGVGATVKHFVANDAETERYTVDVQVDERVLRELYLYPFEVIVRQTGVWSVMAAYNSVNGTTMNESKMLREILHEEWGFDGVTMSDWYAGRSTEPAANSALDLVMPGPHGPWGDALVDAVHHGRVAEALVDDKVLRILSLARRVGALDVTTESGAATTAWSEEQARQQLRSSAAAGFVLLRNTGNESGDQASPLLPLRRDSLSSLAVIGPNAAHGRTLGGGSALVFPPYTVSPLEGVREAVGPSVTVGSAMGVRAHTRLQPADVAALRVPDADEEGVDLRFVSASGEILGGERRRASAYTWHGMIGDVPAHRAAAVEVRTRLQARESGRYTVGGSGVGRFVLTLDGVVRFDVELRLPAGADPVEALMAPPQQGHDVHLESGAELDVVLRYEPPAAASAEPPTVTFQLITEPPYAGDDTEISRAVALAESADVAVVVVGTTEEVESEGFDRDSLALPGRQHELVSRVAAVNPRTVVVVNAGAPVLLPWRDEVAAVLVTWFPGQEFGNALADVLLGVTEPGGRLPMTWPAREDTSLASTRPVGGVLAYDEGVDIGYRRFLRDAEEPAYWFGAGQGYTNWRYGRTAVDVAGDDVRVSATLRNTGHRTGREVVQVYLSRADSQVERPLRWLAGHAAAVAEPGQEVRVDIDLPRRRFAHWDATVGSWAVEPGPFDVQVGSSADHIFATHPVTLDALS